MFFWNIRGLNISTKQFQLKDILGRFIGHLICLLETHLRQENQSKVLQLIKPSWECADNYFFAPLGRIWIMCSSDVSLSVLRCSSQAIHCHIFSNSLQKYFFMSVIYDSNKEVERRLLWLDLPDLKNHMPNVPWLVFGDFNDIRMMT